MVCEKCGKDIPGGSAFCPSCGEIVAPPRKRSGDTEELFPTMMPPVETPVENPPPPPTPQPDPKAATKPDNTPAPPPNPNPNPNPTPTPAPAPAPNSEKKKRRAAVWIVLAVLLVLGLVVGILFVAGAFDRDNDKDDDNNDIVQTDPDLSAETCEALAQEFVIAQEFNDSQSRIQMSLYDYHGRMRDSAVNTYGDEEAFFQQMSDNLGVKITDWDKLYNEMYNDTLISADETFGSYTISTAVLNTQSLTQSAIEQYVTDLVTLYGDYVDADGIAAVSQGYLVTVNIEIDGDEKDYIATYDVCLLRYNGEWKVASYTVS